VYAEAYAQAKAACTGWDVDGTQRYLAGLRAERAILDYAFEHLPGAEANAVVALLDAHCEEVVDAAVALDLRGADAVN
jgi:hypothetical protein